MTYYLSYVKDTLDNNYLGIKIEIGHVLTYLEKLKSVLSESDYESYTQNQQNRDHGSHHITVVNVQDYNKLSREIGLSNFVENLEDILKYPVDDIKMLGLGTAGKNENRAYFVVCQSDKLDAIRTRFDLPKQDFHITLGFKWKDVFGVRKNEIMNIKSRFLKELKQEFYKKDNFNFIKKISNYDLDEDAQIIPISISDDFIKILCDDMIMDVGFSSDKNELFIFTKYKKSTDVSRLPLTEIYRILENI